jgi:hypothetical protein
MRIYSRIAPTRWPRDSLPNGNPMNSELRCAESHLHASSQRSASAYRPDRPSARGFTRRCNRPETFSRGRACGSGRERSERKRVLGGAAADELRSCVVRPPRSRSLSTAVVRRRSRCLGSGWCHAAALPERGRHRPLRSAHVSSDGTTTRARRCARSPCSRRVMPNSRLDELLPHGWTPSTERPFPLHIPTFYCGPSRRNRCGCRDTYALPSHARARNEA